MGVRSYSNYVIIMAGMGGGAFSIHLNGASMNSDGLEAMMQFESGVAKMAVEMASFFPDLSPPQPRSSFVVDGGDGGVDLFPCSVEARKSINLLP